MAFRWAARRCLSTTSFHLTPATPAIHVGLLLKRAPMLLSERSDMEKAYYAYREAQDRGEARPFQASLYFKKGSFSEQRWEEAMAAHPTNLGAAIAQFHAAEARESKPAQKEWDQSPTSLNRCMKRTLYLVVRQGQGEWGFPQSPVEASELLHEGAQRMVSQVCGSTVDTWVVGRVPVGHYADASTKVYFIKAHMMAGRVEGPQGMNHAWLTKEELKDYLKPEFYTAVKDMLTDL